MKRFISFILFFITLSACFLIAACGDTTDDDGETYYAAASRFSYSVDGGRTYGKAQEAFEVGETIYMKLQVKVTSNKEETETISIKLTIPNITAVDAKYFDGQPITPTYDSIENITTYEFTVLASRNAQEWEFVFQFIPNAASEFDMLLRFDENYDSLSPYNKNEPIKFEGEDFTYLTEYVRYEIVDGAATLVWCDPKVTTLNIGNEYSGYPITKIGDSAFKYCKHLENVTLPNGIVAIGDKAFYYCSKLKSINLPESLTSIGEEAFYNCTSLEEIRIPKGVEVIERNTFWYCEGLKNLSFSDGVREIGQEAFAYCDALEEVRLPGSLEVLDSAFKGCRNLKTVYIPDSVEYIGRPFWECYALTTVYCEASSRPIPWPEDWFDGTTAYGTSDKLTIVWGASDMFPEDSENNNKYAGYETSAIRYEGNSYGGYNAKKCDPDATKVRIYDVCNGRSVTHISSFAFGDCQNLTDVIIPDSIYWIHGYAFENCIGLKKIYIPGSVENMDPSIFRGCENIVIYCEAEQEPDGWSDFWRDGSSATVVWGCDRAEYEALQNATE